MDPESLLARVLLAELGTEIDDRIGATDTVAVGSSPW